MECFSAPLQPSELQAIKRVVSEKLHPQVGLRRDPNSSAPAGTLSLALRGFLCLHALFIERGRIETTWTVLRCFGYGDNLELREDQVPPLLVQDLSAPDQVETTENPLPSLFPPNLP